MKRETCRREEAKRSGALRMERLLRGAFPPVDAASGPARDLWPELRRRIELSAESPDRMELNVPWYDWALAAGVLLMAVASPVSVPVLLYYL